MNENPAPPHQIQYGRHVIRAVKTEVVKVANDLATGRGLEGLWVAVVEIVPGINYERDFAVGFDVHDIAAVSDAMEKAKDLIKKNSLGDPG